MEKLWQNADPSLETWEMDPQMRNSHQGACSNLFGAAWCISKVLGARMVLLRLAAREALATGSGTWQR